MTTYGRIDIAFTHGEGSYLYSEDGKKFLDYASGIAVNAFGHCHPKLVEALKDQASKLWHISCLLYTSPSPRDNRVSRMPSSA